MIETRTSRDEGKLHHLMIDVFFVPGALQPSYCVKEYLREAINRMVNVRILSQ